MNMRSLGEVMAGLRESRGKGQDIVLKNSRDFKIEMGPAKGYQVILEGKPVPLAPSGVSSLCRLLKMDGKYFQRYPRREEFAEHVQTLLPSACQKGVLLRLQDGSVRGVLHSDYTILDDEQILNLISDLGQRILPSIRGVQATSDRGEGSCYRILWGQSVLRKCCDPSRNWTGIMCQEE